MKPGHEHGDHMRHRHDDAESDCARCGQRRDPDLNGWSCGYGGTSASLCPACTVRLHERPRPRLPQVSLDRPVRRRVLLHDGFDIVVPKRICGGRATVTLMGGREADMDARDLACDYERLP